MFARHLPVKLLLHETFVLELCSLHSPCSGEGGEGHLLRALYLLASMI